VFAGLLEDLADEFRVEIEAVLDQLVEQRSDGRETAGLFGLEEQAHDTLGAHAQRTGDNAAIGFVHQQHVGPGFEG